MELNELLELHKKLIELRDYERTLLNAGHLAFAHEVRTCANLMIGHAYRAMGEKFVQNLNDGAEDV